MEHTALSTEVQVSDIYQNEKQHFSFYLQLYLQRMKVCNDEEREKMATIDHNFMSDEEDGEGEQKGVWVVRSPPWRSRDLNRLLSTLQEKLTAKDDSGKHPKNKRAKGAPSARHPPSHAPQWTFSSEAASPASTRRQRQRSPQREESPIRDRSPHCQSRSVTPEPCFSPVICHSTPDRSRNPCRNTGRKNRR